MKRIRVIPVLLVHKNGLVKSEKFKNYRYVGDPINAVKIFNEKEVDELAFIDISASKEKRSPDIKRIREIAGEAFMPLAYGGGITSINEVKEILFSGIEKVTINKSAIGDPSLITKIAERFGSQSVVVCIDVNKNILGRYRVYSDNGQKKTSLDPVDWAIRCEKYGAGEILLNDISRDGTYRGYNLELIKAVSQVVSIPVVACGGAGSIEDFRLAVKEAGASAVSAGSMFVFQRPHNAVLISYPSQEDLNLRLYSGLQ